MTTGARDKVLTRGELPLAEATYATNSELQLPRCTHHTSHTSHRTRICDAHPHIRALHRHLPEQPP